MPGFRGFFLLVGVSSLVGMSMDSFGLFFASSASSAGIQSPTSVSLPFGSFASIESTYEEHLKLILSEHLSSSLLKRKLIFHHLC